MQIRELSLLMLPFLAIALAAGCLGPTGGPQTPTPVPVTTEPTMTYLTVTLTVPVTPNSMEPQPTVTPPNNWDTIITVARAPNTAQPNIIVTYGGGAGQYALQELNIIVTHPDGSTQTKTVPRPPGGSIPSQTQVTIFQDQNEPVRVQVLATYNGIQYPVYDQIVPPI